MIKGSFKDIKDLDKVLSETCTLIKDSSNRGSKAYTKVYRIKGNPVYKRIRLFFDERDKSGTIKIQNYYGLVVGICTFTLIQAGTLIQQTITAWF